MDDTSGIAREALAAGGAGLLAALARIATAADEQPMLRPATAIRIAGDTIGALGCWIVIHALGGDGWMAVAGSAAGGALGFVVLHDALLRVLKQRTQRR